MKKQERQNQIMRMLEARDELLVITVCRTFGVVPMTVRRDFEDLEKKGLIIRTHGGAVLKQKKTFDTETPLIRRTKIHIDQKKQIAKKGLDYICSNDTVFMASGSTVDTFTCSLYNYVPLTVITDAVNVAYRLSDDDNIQLFILGGQIRTNSLSITGDEALFQLKRYSIHKAFIGINGIDNEGNIFTSTVVESGIIEVLFKIVKDVFILATADKLMKKSLVPVQTSRPYTLITTYGFTEEEKIPFIKKGIKIVQCL